MSNTGRGSGFTFVYLLIGLCTKTVIAFLLQYKLDSYPKYSRHKLYYADSDERNPIIVTVPPKRDIFSNEVHDLKLNEVEGELLYNGRVNKSHYSLASKLHVTDVPLSQEGFNQHPIHVFGHRGSPYTALENTSRSFIHAAQAGADGIELDVFLLKCGTLVVFHGSGGDENPGLLHSYCGVEGSILDFTAEEARRLLTFNKNFDEFGCGPNQITHPDDSKSKLPHYCYVHTLEEVLTTLGDHPDVSPKLKIKIELKGPNTAAPAVQLVQKLKMKHRCQYSSFDHSLIAEVRMLDADAITGALFASQVPDDFVERCIAVGASEVHFKYDTCSYERVQVAHAAGLTTMAWFRGPIGMKDDYLNKYFDVGNEDEAMYTTVLRSGVTSMCVNRPGILVNALKKTQGVESHRHIWHDQTLARSDMEIVNKIHPE
mmetsp:Transcript_20082/g.37825  ORF Transcript_20082/g.37825 Transcript_20082/m.37825 type:complete len:429 (-) Transcript_20082:548-1834(-)